ncbi:MAG TPA: pyridoxal-phosphate dependent enzyme [Roseiarcus sp.]|nr:pyridoxal-phosphate dependent enzyme [Roseiarcus sp.]
MDTENDKQGLIGLGDVLAAAKRIAGYIRRTPLLRADQCAEPIGDADLWLKLENLQPTGSFKARGATNKLLTTPRAALAKGIVTASGGNHGLATARAARLAGVPATVFVPETVAAEKVDKLRRWGAEVRKRGALWDEANREAIDFAERAGAVYFHPFADPAVVAGQGTLGIEILDELGDVETLIVAIGGGGLIAGIATAVKARQPSVRIIGVEPVGSPTLHRSLAAGRVVRLPEVTTRVATMACGMTEEPIFEIVRRSVDEVVLIKDDDMLDAARWLWFEFGIAADLSGAAAVAALRAGRVRTNPGERVCGLVCGAGSEGVSAA